MRESLYQFRFSSLAENWGVHAKLIYKYQILYLDHITIVPWHHLVNDIDLCHSPKSPPKSIKPPIVAFKVTEFGANREPMYDFLLVINSNLCPISHHYWDTATYWPKIENIAHPSSFSTLVGGDPLWIYGKAPWFPKLESSRQPTVKIWWSYLAPFLTDPPMWQKDGWTDRQNCNG